MHATIRRYADNALAAPLRENEASVRNLMSAISGFRAYYFVETPEGGVSVTVCDDEAGTTESNGVAAAWIRENMPDLATSPPTISAGDVAISF